MTALAGLLVFAFATASAGEFPLVQVTEASYVAPPSVTRQGTVCSAYDQSVCADVGRFYEAANRQLLRVGFIAAFSPSWGMRTQFTLGAKAPKVSVNPRLVLGLLNSRSLGRGSTLSAEVSASVGGDVRHHPCIDDYDRKYYCGSLTAWEDFPDKHTYFNEYRLTLTYRH